MAQKFTERDFTAYPTVSGSVPTTTKGDLSGYSTTQARIPVGSDDQVLTADSSQTLGVKWAASGSSGGYAGTWLDALFNRPSGETAHTDDDELDGTISGTALAPTGTATWTQDKHALSVVFDSSSTYDVMCRLYSLTPTSSPVTVETAMRIMVSNDNTPTIGLVLSDGITTAANAVYAYWDTQSPSLAIRTGTITNLSTLATNDAPSSMTLSTHIYLRIIWTASNTFEIAASADGISWTKMGTSSASKTMTPTHFGVGVGNWGTTIKQIASFEYLRITESDLSV